MGSFGEDLRKAREAKGVTLEMIAAATKLTTRYLQAVEQERFDELPGGVFRKSIVRSYARCADLDEDAWVKRYKATAHEDDSFREDDQAWMEFAENVGRARPQGDRDGHAAGRWAGVAALLLLVIGMSWFVWGYVHNKAAAASKTPGGSAMTAQSRSAAGNY
jgi:cytoskeleton protein RodZ